MISNRIYFRPFLFDMFDIDIIYFDFDISASYLALLFYHLYNGSVYMLYVKLHVLGLYCCIIHEVSLSQMSVCI